jgi:CSLREA domain-containing protein
MLNILGVHDGSIICSDIIKGSSAAATCSLREAIIAADINVSVLLQCMAARAQPSLPLQASTG